MRSLIEEAKRRGFTIYINDDNPGVPDYALKHHCIILDPLMTDEEIKNKIEAKFKEFEGKEWYFEVTGLTTKHQPTQPELALTSKEVVDKSTGYDVYAAIESERLYQLKKEDSDDSHIVSSLNMGGILTAIQYNLTKAQETWYNEKEPYSNTTELLRKIAALCVKAGEDYGMANRT